MPLLKYLADTNAVSDFLEPRPEVRAWFAAHPDEIGLSTITLAEMRRGIEGKPAGKRRNALERDFRFALEDFRGAIFVFDEAAAFEWGRLLAEADRRGHVLAYDDSLIAAIARSLQMIVVTHNVKHFPGVETVDPWDGSERPRWTE